MQKIRGEKISAIFQEPMSSLNPLHTIDKQISEILMTHSSISKKEAEAKTSELLNEVGLKEIANSLAKALTIKLSQSPAGASEIIKITIVDKIKGIIIELIKNCANLELGIKINITQKGRTPKLDQRYIFSNVKYS